MHGLAAELQETRSVGEGQGTRRAEGRVLAKGVAGHEGGAVNADPEFPLQRPHHGKTDSHEGGLSVFRQGELVLGTLPHQGGELLAKGLVDLLEDLAGRSKGNGQVGAHADGLAALARKQKGKTHDRRSSPMLATGEG